MIDTGLRRGEMIGLQWGDLSFTDSTIYVRRSIGPHDDPEDDDATTKTEAGARLVPMFAASREVFKQLLVAHREKTGEPPADDQPVFGTIERKRGRDGVVRGLGHPLSPRLVTRAFRRYADRAEFGRGKCLIQW
jgi:integrase